ncbi:uncharacterized protein LOC141655459 [Silene latifolia]|uniref:uncharacterized protein LOC141655459 n=1 Tax=Silene latifolia TaxID=37657 RepID=UPI003D777E2B
MGPKRSREPEDGNKDDLKRSKVNFPKKKLSKVPGTSKLNIASNIKVSCRPNGLVNLVKQLGPNQRKAVIEIGFGGLLDFKVTSIPLGVIPLFVKHFNATAHIFKARDVKFLLSKDDVCDVFGLPNGGDKVEVVYTGHSVLSSQETLKAEFRKKFNVEGTNYVTIPLLFYLQFRFGG